MSVIRRCCPSLTVSAWPDFAGITCSWIWFTLGVPPLSDVLHRAGIAQHAHRAAVERAADAAGLLVRDLGPPNAGLAPRADRRRGLLDHEDHPRPERGRVCGRVAGRLASAIDLDARVTL